MDLDAAQLQRIREWILAGRSDEEIAAMMVLSVKQVRPIRQVLEQSLRPR